MPADLTIGPPAAAPSAPLAATTVRPADAAGHGFTAPNSNQAAKSPAPDTRVVLDARSDRVVLEYVDATGAVVNSLPSQRQLEAYRLAAASSRNDTAGPDKT